MKKMILLLLSIPLFAHHPEHKDDLKSIKKEISFKQKGLYFYSSIKDSPIVGKLSNLSGYLKSEKNILPIFYQIEIQNIDHEETIFRAQTISSDGNFIWQYQFFDGAPHKIFVSVYDNKNNLILSDFFIKEVEAVEPPLFSIVRSMILLLSITFFGIVVGYFVSYVIWKNRISNENPNN